MFLKFQIFCTCHSEYTVNEDISTNKIVCPNCGLEYPHSAKVLSILKTAKEIPESDMFNFDECDIRIISLEKDMKKHQ